jgi:hypothetical protein
MVEYHKTKQMDYMNTEDKKAFVKNRYHFHKKGLKHLASSPKYKGQKNQSEEWFEEQAALRTLIDADRVRLKAGKVGTSKQWKYG